MKITSLVGMPALSLGILYGIWKAVFHFTQDAHTAWIGVGLFFALSSIFMVVFIYFDQKGQPEK